MHPVERRAARERLVAHMEAGLSWQAAAAAAGVVVGRSTAFRLRRRVQREGPSALDDHRHGHPAKFRPPIQDWVLATCRAAPHTPSQALQTALHRQFGLTVSVRQINRVRRALGVPFVRAPHPKKR